jgi:hypothetical protein
LADQSQPDTTAQMMAAFDVARHDRMVALVTQMLDLHERLVAEGVPHDSGGRLRSSGGSR